MSALTKFRLTVEDPQDHDLQPQEGRTMLGDGQYLFWVSTAEIDKHDDIENYDQWCLAVNAEAV
jgi:hypothetical protein